MNSRDIECFGWAVMTAGIAGSTRRAEKASLRRDWADDPRRLRETPERCAGAELTREEGMDGPVEGFGPGEGGSHCDLQQVARWSGSGAAGSREVTRLCGILEAAVDFGLNWQVVNTGFEK